MFGKMEEYVKRQKQLKANQSLIESLFKVVILCGKQRIPLHGHKMMALNGMMKYHTVINIILLVGLIQSRD